MNINKEKQKRSANIFKFMRYSEDSENSMQYVRDLIENHRIHLSSPTSFNDPFDSAFSILNPDDANTIAASEKMFATYTKSMSIKRQIIEALKSKYKISSFCGNNSDKRNV